MEVRSETESSGEGWGGGYGYGYPISMGGGSMSGGGGQMSEKASLSPFYDLAASTEVSAAIFTSRNRR